MANHKKQTKKTGMWLIAIAGVLFVAAITVIILSNSHIAEDVLVSGSTDVSGFKCVDTSQLNDFLKDYTPASHKNTITATFTNGDFSSMTYAYEGNYADNAEADHARDFAEAAYGTFLNSEGLDITTFTKSFSVNENKFYASITATDVKNLQPRVAPIFMLSKAQNFPTTLEGMLTAYQNAGFSCEATD